MSDQGPTRAERRRLQRKAAIKIGRIVYSRGARSAECRISNLSEVGTCLNLTDIVELPETFDLKFLDGPPRPCKIRWRRGTRLGVEFQKVNPKA